MPGAVLIDKPAGVTSHDVVARIRRERGCKTGHAGTLDPFATGLLIVLLGRATRLQRYLLALPKAYRATARLGWRSSTGDRDGELTETRRVPRSLELPEGRLRQRVPMTSAVKVGGERLYRRAHRGETVETPLREVEVYRAELLAGDRDRAEYEIECSSGTYVRALIETLEDAYCESLRRTAIGPFAVPDAGEVELQANELMAFLPERELNAEETRRVSHGMAVPLGDVELPRGALRKFLPSEARRAPRGMLDIPPQHFRLTSEGRLIAIARREGENLRPEVVLV